MAEPTALSPEQLRALGRLKGLLEPDRYYLAGGTAVAYHLGHRRSRDLDIFSAAPVDLEQLGHRLTASTPEIEVLASTDAVLQLKLGDVPVDLVSYPHAPLLEPAPGPADFATADLLDLATMKLSAIARRGIRRDFWDLYAITTRSQVTLDDALDAYVRRFARSESDLYHVLRALTYFDDAEAETAPLEGMTDALWSQVRSYFEREAPGALRRRASTP